jgi:hypothetical protein
MAVPDGSVFGAFPRQRPAPRILVGGSGWDYLDLPPGVGRSRSLPEAVEQVLDVVRA